MNYDAPGREAFGKGGLNKQLDAEQLLREIDLDHSEITWRKDFVGFDQEDVRCLESYQDIFGAHAEQIASMVDELVSQATRVADEIEDVATANEEQASKVTEINETVGMLTETDSSTH
jgi:hypothetical protein